MTYLIKIFNNLDVLYPIKSYKLTFKISHGMVSVKISTKKTILYTLRIICIKLINDYHLHIFRCIFKSNMNEIFSESYFYN